MNPSQPQPPPPPPVWLPPPPLSEGRIRSVTSRCWEHVSPAGSYSRALGFARATLVLQGFATSALGVMALLLAAAIAASGAQWLPLAGLSLVVAALIASIAAGMFIGSAKLGLLSSRARYLTILAELLLSAPGVALVALGNHAMQHAGTPANPGTDGPFADGGEGLIALAGMAYAGGAVVIMSLLLFAPTVRRGFGKHRGEPTPTGAVPG
jgi:hypothetical protein